MTRIILKQVVPEAFILLQQDNTPVQFLLTNTGPSGASAYQSWLNQGNDATEAEWLESLKGVNSTSISSDYANALTFGTDTKLYVPTLIDVNGGVDLTLIFDNQII